MVILFACGCVNPPAKSDTYCQADSDCACGMRVGSGACFYGNKEYVNTSGQCPDFCGGIAGNLVLRCVNESCVQHRE